MSEFYSHRRVAIKDATALLAFFVAFAWSAPLAWPYLTAEVSRGDMARGLWYFAAIVLATALVIGAAGLEAGTVIGWGWERYHRRRRARVAATRTNSNTSLGLKRPGAPLLHDDMAEAVKFTDCVRLTTDEVMPVHGALLRTGSGGSRVIAWYGDQLVGVARVMTDIDAVSAVVEVTLGQEYRGLGVGKKLLRAALDAAPTRF